MASHEFRTPLTTIMNSMSLLSRYVEAGSNKEKSSRHIQRVKTSVHNLIGILNDFLSLDKLEEEKVTVRFTRFNIPEFTEDIIESIQNTTKKGQHIEYDHSGETEITTDKQMLLNIFNNLLSNAIKYSSKGSTVYLETMIDNDEFTAKVRDEGIGIPDEEQAHLFERFFRAKNAQNIEGTGLGLHIVKKYLDKIGGNCFF